MENNFNVNEQTQVQEQAKETQVAQNIETGLEQVEVKQKKPFNKTIALVLVAAVVIIAAIAFIAPAVYATFSPMNKVKTALNNTVNALEESNRRLEGDVNFLSVFDKEKNVESEIYLELKDSNLSAVIENLDAFYGFGIGLKAQVAKGYEEGNIFTSLYKDKNEVLTARMYYDKEMLALEVKKLFSSILGVKFTELDQLGEELGEFGNEFDSSIAFNGLLKSYFANIELSEKLTKKVEGISAEYQKRFEGLLEFEEKNGRFTTVIAGEDFVKLVKEFITDIIKTEEFKEYMRNNLGASLGTTTEQETEMMVNQLIAMLPSQLDSAFTMVTIGDITITVDVENKFAKNMEVSSTITSLGQVINVNMKFTYDDNEQERALNFSAILTNGTEEISLNGFAKFNKEENAKGEIGIEAIGDGDRISINATSTMNKDKTFSSIVSFNMGMDDIPTFASIKCEASGKHSANRVDYDSIKLGIDSDSSEEMEIEFEGYATVNNVNAIEPIDKGQVKSVVTLTEEEVANLQQSIMLNLYTILSELGLSNMDF